MTNREKKDRKKFENHLRHDVLPKIIVNRLYFTTSTVKKALDEKFNVDDAYIEEYLDTLVVNGVLDEDKRTNKHYKVYCNSKRTYTSMEMAVSEDIKNAFHNMRITGYAGFKPKECLSLQADVRNLIAEQFRHSHTFSTGLIMEIARDIGVCLHRHMPLRDASLYRVGCYVRKALKETHVFDEIRHIENGYLKAMIEEGIMESLEQARAGNPAPQWQACRCCLCKRYS